MSALTSFWERLGRTSLERVVRGLLLLVIFTLPFSIVLIVSHSHELVAGRLNQFAVPTLYPQEALMALTAILWVFLRRQTAGLWPFRQLVIILGIAVLSILWAPYQLLAAVTAGHLLLAFGLLYVAAEEFRDVKFLQTAIWVFTASVSIQAVWGIGQFLAGRDLGLHRLGEGYLSSGGQNVAKVWDSGPHLRAYGSLPHPNLMAAYVATAIFWVGTVIFWPFRDHPKLRQAALAALLVLLGACLVLTFSRVALLMTAVNGTLVILFCYRRWHRLPVAAAVAAVSTVIVAALVAPLLAGRTTVESPRETGVSNRVVTYELAATMMSNRPAGVGAGNFVLAARELRELPAYQYQPAHNALLLVGAELGALSAVLLAWFIVRIGWTYHHLRTRDRRTNTANFALFALCGVFIMMGATDHFFWSLPQGLWLIVLVTAAVVSRIPKKQLAHPAG